MNWWEQLVIATITSMEEAAARKEADALRAPTGSRVQAHDEGQAFAYRCVAEALRRDVEQRRRLDRPPAGKRGRGKKR
jgi:hypothetical protein